MQRPTRIMSYSAKNLWIWDLGWQNRSSLSLSSSILRATRGIIVSWNSFTSVSEGRTSSGVNPRGAGRSEWIHKTWYRAGSCNAYKSCSPANGQSCSVASFSLPQFSLLSTKITTSYFSASNSLLQSCNDRLSPHLCLISVGQGQPLHDAAEQHFRRIGQRWQEVMNSWQNFH